MPDSRATTPSYDPELLPVLLSLLPAELPDAAALISGSRKDLPTAHDVLVGRALAHQEHLLEHDGVQTAISVFSRPDHRGASPGVFFLHGGGMVGLNRFADVPVALEWAELFDVVVATVEYRLAPEHPHPAPSDDAFAALTWFHQNAAELGVDAEQILLCGVSAGGGLTAGLALRWRDSGGTALLGQVLVCPMLDDRNVEPDPGSDELALWDHSRNEIGWSALLGSRRGAPDVSPYAAAARSDDLSNLPAAFIDVGSADIFRDEDVAYAEAIWASGGSAELHVWPGGFHAFDVLVPNAALSREAVRTRTAWVARTFGA